MNTGAAPRRDVLLVKSGGDAAVPEWQAAFARLAPELEVRGWNDPTVEPDAVTYVVVWEPDAGRLASYRNLKVIFSSAAGVDHIICDPTVPAHLPIVRMVTDETGQTMGEYVCLAALSILRDYQRIISAQAERRWDNFEPSYTARDKCVGILGFGTLARTSARMLQALGFNVIGWTRTPRAADGVELFAGRDALPAFLGRADILVNLLPDTEDTRGLLNRHMLDRLPHGAGLVNAGRGSALVLPDLIAALNCGQIGSAVLDVFEPEPLPPDSPVWAHPRITVTAHLAGYASRPARAAAVVEALRAMQRGEPTPRVFDRVRGY